jgi:mycothiol synthase
VELRTVTTLDAPAVADLMTACDIDVLGQADITLQEIVSDLSRADLQHYGWFSDAVLLAYGSVGDHGDTAQVQLDAYVRPDAEDDLGPQVIAHLTAAAVRIAALRSHDHADLHHGAFRHDERLRAWLRAAGFTVQTTFTRMRIDFDAPVDAPVPPVGVEIRRSDNDEGDLRIAHRVQQAAFAEHFGHAPQEFGFWRERLFENGADWSSLWLATLDGDPVGELIATKRFADDENAGYVATLGVLAGARGRGIAKLLLHSYFAAAYAAGHRAVLLHVDQANVTNALGVYEAVGMRPVLQIDAWGKTVPVI